MLMRNLPGKGIVTFAFDDAYLDTYRCAIRYLIKLGIHSTISVPSSLVGKACEMRPVMGKKELKNVIKNGHEIASHGLTHTNLLKLSLKDKKSAFNEISLSKKILKRCFDYNVSSFIFPYIKRNHSRELYLECKKYYKSARITSPKPYFSSLPPNDPYDIVGFAVTTKHTVPILNKLADYAAKKKLWLIEVFHLVGEKNTLSAHRPKPYRYFTHVDDFKKHVDHILSKDLLILTQKDVIQKFKNV